MFIPSIHLVNMFISRARNGCNKSLYAIKVLDKFMVNPTNLEESMIVTKIRNTIEDLERFVA
jgi:hypothetical protein